MNEKTNKTQNNNEADYKEDLIGGTNRLIKIFEKYLHQRQRWWLIRSMLLLSVAMIGVAIMLVVQGKIWDVQGVAPEDSVAVIQINGVIGQDEDAVSENILPLIKKAFMNERTKAVLLHISSPGGSPTTADRIATYARTMAEKHNKPLHAHIDSMGASAAYMIAVSADEVTASKYSLVGSIGAILAVYDYHELTDRVGIKQRAYKSGKLKDMLSGWRPENKYERAVANNLVNEVKDQFYNDVLDRRQGKLTREKEYLATGRVWVAPEALKLGLIDDIGTLDDIVRARWDAPMFEYKKQKSIFYKLSGQINTVMVKLGMASELGSQYEIRM